MISPARRTRQTWQLASAQWDAEVPTAIDDRIYAAHPDELLQVVVGGRRSGGTGAGRSQSCREELAEIPGRPRQRRGALARLQIKFPTAAIAVINSDLPWADWRSGSARLTDFVVPRG